MCLYLMYQVTEVLGGDKSGVENVRLKNTADGSEETLAVNGLFLAIGHTPNTCT